MKITVLILAFAFATAIDVEEIEDSEICPDEDCSTECDGQSCNYCSGSTCCKTQQCNTCVNRCRSDCSTSNCNNQCLQSCSRQQSYCNRCNSCPQRSSSRSCRPCYRDSWKQTDKIIEKSSDPISTNSNSETKPVVNVTTNIDLKNLINNTNSIHNPITIHNTNINNINITIPEIKPQPEIITAKPQNCCMVIPPKNCTYQPDLRCVQNPYKICSPACNSPVIVPHPVPVFVARPYPVLQPVPVPIIKHVPVPQPFSVPVPQVVNRPVYIPVNQRVYIPQPVAAPCPNVNYGGVTVPVCRSILDTRQFIGSSQHFLIDQYATQTPQCRITSSPPYYVCNNLQIESCGQCSYCHGQFNPRQCSQLPTCPISCRTAVHNPQLIPQMQTQLSCFTHNNQVQCV